MSINTLVQGAGRPVALIHGFCEDLSIWSRLQTKLSQFYQVISVDLPGFGASPSLVTGFSIDDVADELHREIKTLTDEPYPVIGHSLGGYVALSIAERYYDEISALGLFHSTSYSDPSEKKLNRDKTINFIIEHGPEQWIRTFVPGLFYKENVLELQDEIDNLISIASKIDPATIIDYSKAMRDRPDRSKIFFNLSKPRMFIGGEKDIAVSYRDSLSQINNIEGETTCIFEKTGHMGMYEEPSESYRLFKDFLERIY